MKHTSASALSTLVSRIGTDKKHNPSQFYRTPHEASVAFFNAEGRRIRRISRVLQEPASGEGHIASVMKAYGFDVHASDLRRGPEICGRRGIDFLQTRKLRAPVIITNPPFGDVATAFIRHAARIGAQYLALLLPAGFFQSAEDKMKCWRELTPTRIWPVGFRLDFSGQGRPLANPFCWFVWDWCGLERVQRIDAAPRCFGEPCAQFMPALTRPTHMILPFAEVA